MKNETNKNNEIIEKIYPILDCESRNKNYRFYPTDVVKKWFDLLEQKIKDNAYGIDVEYALGNEEIENEFLLEHLSCGVITKLELKGNKLFGTILFKQNELTKDIYSGKINLDEITIVPKGKGSVRNQKVQDDYELYGFNLVKKEESSFAEEKEEKKEEVVA